MPVFIALASAIAAEGLYLRALRRHHGLRVTMSRPQHAAFVSGLVLVVAVLAPPLDGWADTRFSVHMCQHLVLGLVAPLLLVLGGAVTVFAANLRPVTTRIHPPRLRSAVGVGLLAVAAHTLSFWLWHVPALFDAAVRSDAVHALEHATLLGAGLAFWAVVLGGGHVRSRRALAARGVVLVFLAGLGSGLLAALLTLAPHALYSTAPSLSDQQLAGAVMWVPGGIVYLGAGAVLFIRMLQSDPASRSAQLARATVSASGPAGT